MQRSFQMIIVIACLVACTATTVYAQDDGGGGGGKPFTVMDSIKAGGPIGALIIVMSVISLTLIITNAMAIRRDQLVPPEILGQVEAYFDDEEYEDAMTLCETNPSFLTNVLAAGLPKINLGWEQVKVSLEEATEQESVKLQQQISYLSLIGTVAPMMGLLGTVTGMIAAFNTIASSGGTADAAKLAGGISMALVTTCEGLIVAIPTQAAFFVLRNTVTKCVVEVAAISEELMERFAFDEE